MDIWILPIVLADNVTMNISVHIFALTSVLNILSIHLKIEFLNKFGIVLNFLISCQAIFLIYGVTWYSHHQYTRAPTYP